ncbi:hypothetical protein PAPYR_9391 [Paratrimastix pyriformis]|uniref:Uncharacterized protein n=1 Tax=Paratrimastix pyriformis TaxID=342808 RepID=A0ABQ8U8K2_9EUKA|nr:hypothetical protein PAPYR_9391 [Paratrimastix pyriformis]
MQQTQAELSEDPVPSQPQPLPVVAVQQSPRPHVPPHVPSIASSFGKPRHTQRSSVALTEEHKPLSPSTTSRIPTPTRLSPRSSSLSRQGPQNYQTPVVTFRPASTTPGVPSPNITSPRRSVSAPRCATRGTCCIPAVPPSASGRQPQSQEGDPRDKLIESLRTQIDRLSKELKLVDRYSRLKDKAISRYETGLWMSPSPEIFPGVRNDSPLKTGVAPARTLHYLLGHDDPNRAWR